MVKIPAKINNPPPIETAKTDEIIKNIGAS
jgi:hypothetical protein